MDTIIDTYKNRVLPELEDHSLIYKFEYKDPEEWDFLEIVEELEKIDMYEYDLRSTKLDDWKIVDDEEWGLWRFWNDIHFQNWMKPFQLPGWDVEGYLISDEAQYFQCMVERHLVS